MPRLIIAAAALAAACTPQIEGRAPAAQAAPTVWILSSCQSNGWGCQREATYDTYPECNNARKAYKEEHPDRTAWCAQA